MMKSRNVRGAGRVARRGEERNKTTRRPRHRWMYNVKMDFGGMDWIDLAQDVGRWRALVVNTVILVNLRVL
jgi:hypothetical protein